MNTVWSSLYACTSCNSAILVSHESLEGREALAKGSGKMVEESKNRVCSARRPRRTSDASPLQPPATCAPALILLLSHFHLRIPYIPPDDMETIDIARLKSGEVNLGVCFYVPVEYSEGELIIASGYRPRSWQSNSRTALSSAQTLALPRAATSYVSHKYLDATNT